MKMRNQPRTSAELTAALAQALGVGKATRAVLTLEAGQPPRLQVETLMTDSAGRYVMEQAGGEYGEPADVRIRRLQFMLRLEPFPEAK